MVIPLFSCSGDFDHEDNGGDSGNGDTDKPVEEISSGYRQKMIAMQFTSVGCVNCPYLSEAVKEIQKDFPERIIPIAFHMDYGNEPDPMSLPVNDKFYKKLSHSGDALSLPMFAFNFRKSSQPIINEYSKIAEELELEMEQYPADCGVALETFYDASSRTAEIKAKFKSDVSASYRYHIFLVEDGVEYAQMGVEDGSYVHNNVLRHMCADHIYGAKLEKGEELIPGTEYVVEKKAALDKDWNASNVRVVAAMLCSEDDGYTYFSNNAASCALGGSVDYEYEK